MRCNKCGLEIGTNQKCSLCSPFNPKTSKQECKILGDLGEAFVKGHLESWEYDFDDLFYEQEKLRGLSYRELLMSCLRWFQIFCDIASMLPEEGKIPASMMIKIMDEIPARFSEISEGRARSLAKEIMSWNNVGLKKHLANLARDRMQNAHSCNLSAGGLSVDSTDTTFSIEGEIEIAEITNGMSV